MPRNYQLTWSPPAPGIAVAANGRYLLKDGVPWLPNVAAGSWFAIQAISNSDSSSFFDTLASAGFNTAHVSAIANDTSRYPSDSGNHFGAPNWNNGSGAVPPFLLPGGVMDFSTFQSAYSTHMQDRLAYMATKDLTPILNGMYVGFDGANGSSNQGFASQMFFDTDAHCNAFGVSLANAVKATRYLMLSEGGDCHPAVGSVIESRLVAFHSGYNSVDPGRIWMAHLDGFSGGECPYDQATIGALAGMISSHYCYDESSKRAWRKIAEAYARGPVLPAFVFDPSYEGDPATSSRNEIRRRDHMTMCAGACSMAYARGDGSGAGTGWYWSTTNSWLTSLPGLADHRSAYAIWSALPWYAMAPDTGGTFVTAGRGTATDTADDYVGVRASPACLVAEFQDQSKLITVDMSQLTGAGVVSSAGVRRAEWVDPTNNTTSLISASLSTSGTLQFGLGASGARAFPGNNAAGDHDLLLRIY